MIIFLTDAHAWKLIQVNAFELEIEIFEAIPQSGGNEDVKVWVQLGTGGCEGKIGREKGLGTGVQDPCL